MVLYAHTPITYKIAPYHAGSAIRYNIRFKMCLGVVPTSIVMRQLLVWLNLKTEFEWRRSSWSEPTFYFCGKKPCMLFSQLYLMHLYVYLLIDREERLWYTTINLQTDKIFIIFGVVSSQQCLGVVRKPLKLGLYHAWVHTVSCFEVVLLDSSDWNWCCLTFQQYCDNKISKFSISNHHVTLK